MLRWSVFFAALLFSAPMASATDKLYDYFKPKTAPASGAATASDAAGAAVSSLSAKGSPTRAAKIALVKKELTKIAESYRNDFYSTNAYFQSLCNNQIIILGRKMQKVDNEIHKRVLEARNLVEWMHADASDDVKRQLKIEHTARTAAQVLKENRVESWWLERRMVGNCINISRLMFHELRQKFKPGSGIKVGIYNFSDYTDGIRHHQFTVVICGSDTYIVDGWRGSGEVWGPLKLNRKTQLLETKVPGDTLDSYYQKKIEEKGMTKG